MENRIKVAEFYLDFSDNKLKGNFEVLKPRPDLDVHYDKILKDSELTQEEIDKMNKTIKGSKKVLNQYLLDNIPVNCRPYVVEAIKESTEQIENLQAQLFEQRQKFKEQEQINKEQEQKFKQQEEYKKQQEEYKKQQEQVIEELKEKINSFER